MYTYTNDMMLIEEMDPCMFVRILVGNVGVKTPVSSKPCSFSGKVHPSSSPFFCKIQLKGVDSNSPQVSTVPMLSETETHRDFSSLAASFDLSKSQILKKKKQKPVVKISLYKATTAPSCIFSTAKLLGTISIPLDLDLAESSSPCIFRNGWEALSKKPKAQVQLLHLTVRAEVDPRFVFRFGGEPECSPQVFQIKGEVKQPVFTCKFSVPIPVHAHSRERKGWSITVHDLSGSPVAAASMATPFVPSPGSHRVSSSNPGAWLIIRPDADGTWNPWARLHAWRHPNKSNSIGYRFQLLHATSHRVTLTSSSSITSHLGGKFTINSTSTSHCKGFVMSATVHGEAKSTKPELHVGVQHVNCTEDAAAFVALAAALDLTIHACKLFSHKLPKEFRH